MKNKIIIQTPGARSTMFICMLNREDQEKIRSAVTAYIKEYVGDYDISLDNSVSVSVENAMDGRLTDLEDTFEFVYQR